MDDPLGRQLLLQAILIALNAFFAASEIAVLSLNSNKVRKAAEDGDRNAQKMRKLIDEPSGFLSTIQVGITLAGFLGSAFAADNFSDRLISWVYNGLGWKSIPLGVLDTVSVILITVVLSYFTLVFGELVPKRVAMQKSEQLARIAAGVVSGLSVVMRPVVWLLTKSTNGVLRLLGMREKGDTDGVTEEEIRLMVDIGEEKGTIEPEERRMIENVFEFNNTIAGDVMTHISDVEAIGVTMESSEILRILRSSGYSRLPVYEEDPYRYIGILIGREYLLNQCSAKPVPLRQLLRPPYLVPETVHTDILFRNMQAKKVHMAIVVNEFGENAGVITIEDLLEEIVGSIYDESDDHEEPEITPLADGGWRISGQTDIRTISETLGIQLPEDEPYDTLGGLIYSRLDVIPPECSPVPDVEVYGLRIHTERREENRVVWAHVEKIPESVPEDTDV
ncbi:MAG: hemolysin family protein [Clostridiaceae bacterium]|nr:hemolysin family protein [Clostridiaceae bacterium]